MLDDLYPPANKKKLIKDDNENNNEALIYHNRVLVISSTAKVVNFILLFFAIIIPWWVSRSESLKTIHYLVSERISTSSKAFANATENLMKKFEIAGVQLKDLSYDPLLAGCSVDGILSFIRYAQTMNSILEPKPYRFYLSHNQTSACQLELDYSDSLKFNIYMLIPFNQTHDQVKVFNEGTNFHRDYFRPEDKDLGELVQMLPINTSYIRFGNHENSFYSSPYWTTAISYFGNFTENQTLTFVYPHTNSSSMYSTTLSGITISNNEIFKFLSNIPSCNQLNWIILDENFNILFDKDLGATFPYDIVKTVPQYPSIENSQNDMWKDVTQYVRNLKNETPLLINVKEIQYYLIKRQIFTYGGRLMFNILMMICFDDLSDEVFKPVNCLFLIVAILTCFSVFFGWLFKKKTKKKRDKKLFLAYKENNLVVNTNTQNNNFNRINERNLESIDSMSLKVPFFNSGTIGKTISDLRKLELLYPDEIMINKIVSSAANNFAKTQNRLFSVANVSENSKNCEFCKYLKAETFKISETEEQIIPSLKQQQTFLLFQQKLQKLRPIHNFNNDNDSFHPYKYMNLKSNQIITQDLLYENYQEDSTELNNESNTSFSNVKGSNSYYDNQDESPFATWDVLTFDNIKQPVKDKNDRSKANSTSENLDNKIRKKILFELIKLIHDKKLIFSDIDPDQFIEFAFYFSETFLKNSYKTYESLKTIDYLLNMDFGAWINNKLDMFALILSVFARDMEVITDEEEIMFINNEKISYRMEENEINDNNNNDNGDSNANDDNRNDNGNNDDNNINIAINSQTQLSIFEMPIFDLSTCSRSKSFDSNSCNDDDYDSIKKSINHAISESDISDKSFSKDIKENSSSSQFKNEVFTLNDTYSKRTRKVEILKYIFAKFIPLNQHNFNHVYIFQRVRHIFEECLISNHFEIFGEFENRAGSSEFSVINNSEDIDIFMEAIFIFADYSRYWCEIENFDDIFDEYNNQHFTEEELKNTKFIWRFHNEILLRIVKPFFQLLCVFCPLEEMNDKIKNISQFIQLKIEGKPISEASLIFKGIKNDDGSISSYTTTHSSNSVNNSTKSDLSVSLEHQKKRSESGSTNLSLYKQILNPPRSSEYDDVDIFIEDGNGGDVDGD